MDSIETKAKHTPGSWGCFAENIQLMAAAPDLLECVKRSRAEVIDMSNLKLDAETRETMTVWLAALDAAIAKAEG